MPPSGSSNDTPRRQRVIPEQTARVLELAAPLLPAEFALMGGTALAEFYLAHRVSEDLEFFAVGDVDIPAVARLLMGGLEASGLRVRRIASGPTFARLEVLPGLRLDLVRESPPQLGATVDVDGIRVASLLGIAVGKLGAFVTRREGKDAVDLAALAICAGLELPTLYPLLFRKDEGLRLYPQSVFEPLLACAERLPPLPPRLRPELTEEAVQAQLRREADRFWSVTGLAAGVRRQEEGDPDA